MSTFDQRKASDLTVHDNADAEYTGFAPLRELPFRVELPREPTHRRLEAPLLVAVNQTTAGYTLILPPTSGLHYIKLLGAFLTLDAAGTLRFVQGGSQSSSDTAMTGNLGIATNGGFVLPVSRTSEPWMWTSPGQFFGLVTATGKAQGWLVVTISPEDQ